MSENTFASRLESVMKEQGRKWGWLGEQLGMNKNKIHRSVRDDSFTTEQENKIIELLKMNK